MSVGVGRVISDSLSGMTGGAAVGGEPQPSGGVPPANAPGVMTPSEAAQYLRVSEEDVIAAIESGELSARKIGSAYRISQQALDQFLQG